jgi:predicted MPP superfamily phosphohydrolase
VKRYYKALWFALAINLLIVAAHFIIAPIHAANRAQGILGYCLGAIHILNLPGFSAADYCSVRYHPGHAAFAIDLAVNTIFWLAAISVCIRFKHRAHQPQAQSLLTSHPRKPLRPPQPYPNDRRQNRAPVPPSIERRAPLIRANQRALTRRRLLLHSTRAATTAASSLAAYSFFAEPRWFEITHHKIPIKNLSPGLNGLRIVQLTDIHHSQWMSINWVRQIVDAANNLSPDLVALTGDYVYRGIEYVAPVARELARLKPKIGTLAVLGNHDWSDGGGELTKRLFTSENIPLIDNTRRYITPNRRLAASARQGLCIAGVGDLWEDKCLYDDALANVPGGMPRILLSHNPDVAEHPAFLESGHRVDLMLSGHTHGGQISIPGLGAPVTNSAYGQKYVKGLVQGPNCPVFISKGLGMTVMPIRLGVRPEIAVIELQSA